MLVLYYSSIGDGYTHGLDDVVDELLRFVDLLFSIGHDQTVKIFFLVAGVSGVGAAFALLDGAFTTDGNLRLRLSLHLLQRVATRTDK